MVEKSASPAKFRVTSHNFMNPVNKPDAFETKALDRIRANQLFTAPAVRPPTM